MQLSTYRVQIDTSWFCGISKSTKAGCAEPKLQRERMFSCFQSRLSGPLVTVISISSDEQICCPCRALAGYKQKRATRTTRTRQVPFLIFVLVTLRGPKTKLMGGRLTWAPSARRSCVRATAAAALLSNASNNSGLGPRPHKEEISIYLPPLNMTQLYFQGTFGPTNVGLTVFFCTVEFSLCLVASFCKDAPNLPNRKLGTAIHIHTTTFVPCRPFVALNLQFSCAAATLFALSRDPSSSSSSSWLTD